MRRLVRYHLLPPVALFALVLLVWHVSVLVFDIPPYLLPSPVRVWEGAGDRASQLAMASAITGVGALLGFAASLLLGTSTALLFSQSSIIRSCCYPYAIFLQTVPIVAVAPLIVTWLGSGLHSVVVIACVISLFPIITNMTTGLITVSPGLRDLFRMHRATRWQILTKLQIPNAVPHLITGAKTSSGLAVVGAIVGEFFVGYGTQRHGLGYIILYAGPQMKTDQLLAATLASALLGVILFATTALTGRAVLVKWYDASLN